MKRLFCILLVMIMICAASVWAESPAAAMLSFSSSDPVCGISAYYDVLDENIKSIDVTFDSDACGNAMTFANYVAEDKQLIIAIASIRPLDLSKPIATATATLSDNSKIAPALRLEYLKLGDRVASSNVLAQSLTCSISGGKLKANLTLSDDLKGSVSVNFAVYGSNDRFLGIKNASLVMTKETQIFSVDLGKFDDAKTVKAFFNNDSYQPYLKELECTIL